jgi:hypothetical protein
MMEVVSRSENQVGRACREDTPTLAAYPELNKEQYQSPATARVVSAAVCARAWLYTRATPEPTAVVRGSRASRVSLSTR